MDLHVNTWTRSVCIRSCDAYKKPLLRHEKPGCITSNRTCMPFLCQVCNRFMRSCPQIDEEGEETWADDGDGYSSYGTDESGDGPMDTSMTRAAVSGNADITTLIAAVAEFSRGQAVVIEKLTLLEKVVGTVQFDMTWVRDDMKAVNDAMSRIADQVRDPRDATPELERPPEQVSVEASLGLPWKGKEKCAELGKGPSASTSLGEEEYGDVDVPNGNAVTIIPDTFIEETQAFPDATDPYLARMNFTDVGRIEWGYAQDIAVTSPPDPQAMVNIDKEPLEEESQILEMSVQSSQLQTQVGARGIMADLEKVVKDWPAPTEGTGGEEEVWVTTKKGRWDLIDYGKDFGEVGRASDQGDRGILNLNLTPEPQGASIAVMGRGHIAADKPIAGASRNSGNATGKGTGRGKKLPAVSPRFHDPVCAAPEPRAEDVQMTLWNC